MEGWEWIPVMVPPVTPLATVKHRTPRHWHDHVKEHEGTNQSHTADRGKREESNAV
jgi:hypothetical protein